MKTNLQNVIRDVVDVYKIVNTVFTVLIFVFLISVIFLLVVATGDQTAPEPFYLFGHSADQVANYNMLVLFASLVLAMVCIPLSSIFKELMVLTNVNILLEAVDVDDINKVIYNADQDVLKKAERHRQLINERGESNPEAAQALQAATERHKELSSAFDAVFEREEGDEPEAERVVVS